MTHQKIEAAEWVENSIYVFEWPETEVMIPQQLNIKGMDQTCNSGSLYEKLRI